ncbi:MAG: FxsA family protein [Kiritimatiellia bacterium]
MIFSYLVALFVGLPLLELWVLLLIGERIGWAPTILLVIVTGVVGAGLARSQGFQTLAAIQRDMAAGIMPAPRLMDGVMILVAGAMLLTPGILTDVCGFLLLVPATRQIIRNYLRIKLEKKLQEGSVAFTYREF